MRMREQKSVRTPSKKAVKKVVLPKTPYPPAFCAFMLKNWQKPSRKMPPKIRGYQRFWARREALSAQFPKQMLVIPTGGEKVRSNDTYYPFRAGTEFYYLTGNLEPDCVLVLVPDKHQHRTILFVEPDPGRDDTTFFTNSQKGALWVGPRLGIAQSQARFGTDQCLPLSTLPAFLKDIRQAHPKRAIGCLRNIDPRIDACLPTNKKLDTALATHLSEMRLIKDSMEIAAITRACQSTRRGFEDIILQLPQAQTEREIEGVFHLRARVEGNEVGYNTIAACGPHACTLHWSHNSGKIGPKDLILVDAGVEGRDLYTADVTRTLPVSGRFVGAQKQVYEWVLKAQAQALQAARPGADFMAPNRAAMQVLAQALEQMGILASAQEALDPDKLWYKRYTLHNVSHMLGLDVHDCAHARQQTYRYGPLRPGMVLTIEPGLYFQPDDLSVPKRYRGIGVRIEDDILITRSGYRMLSDLPRSCKDIEAWIKKVQRSKKRAPFVVAP